MKARAIIAILLLGILALPSAACGRGGGEAAVGKIAFVSYRDGDVDIYVMDANGSNQTNLTNNPANDSSPAWSPDGSKIAFASYRDGNYEIYVMDADGSNPTNITNNLAEDRAPAWSPDGTRIAFSRLQGSGPDLTGEVWVMDADGSNEVQLTSGDHYTMWCNHSPSWSPDGKRIAFTSGGFVSFASHKIWVMNADGSNLTQLTQDALDTLWDGQPAWSPDGKKIAFESGRQYDHDFNQDIWVMDADGSNQKRLTDDPAYDRSPSWSPDGAKIAFEQQVEKISENVWTTEPAEIWVMDADGSNLTQLTDNSYGDTEPAWGPSAAATPSPTVPGTPGPTPTPAVTMAYPFSPVEIYATPVRSTYLPGEPVTIEFSFKNVYTEPVRIWPFPPRTEVFRLRTGESIRSFAVGSEQMNLNPGETKTYTVVWDQRDADGRQVDPGYYNIGISDVSAQVTGHARIWSISDNVQVFIEYPQGAMEKSIEVNQSQTADGLTITLERVELSATGCEVYAFTTPPNFDPSQQGPPGPPPQEMIPAAQYSVDGGSVRDAGYGGSTIQEDGMELSWPDLDPIPSDAEVLTFTITEVELLFAPTGPSQWSGPWEFEIPLE